MPLVCTPSMVGSHGFRVIFLVISSNTPNYNVFSAAGSPSDPVQVQLTVDPGASAYGSTISTPGIMFGSGWHAGSKFFLINNGMICGAGGAGGIQDFGPGGGNPANAQGGGPALWLNGLTVSITNNTNIWGGGGGGGGGSWTHNGSGFHSGAGGGGGGFIVPGAAGFTGGGFGQSPPAQAGGATFGGNGGPGAGGSAAGIGGNPGAGGAGGNDGTAAGGGGGGSPGFAGGNGGPFFNAGAPGGGAGNAIQLGGGSIIWITMGTVLGPIV